MSETEAAPIETGTVPFQRDTPYLLRRSPTVTGNGAAPLLVALHGQGMTAELMLRLLSLPTETPAHLLVPQGPYPCEKRSQAGIRIGYGWYNYDGNQELFRRELEQSEAHLLRVLKKVSETTRIDPDRTVLVGYSQGGYLAGFVALRHPELFAGLGLVATRFKHEFLAEELDRGTPPKTLFVHATNDPAMALERARESVAHLERAGGTVDEIIHDGGHLIPKTLGTDLTAWMQRHRFSES